MRALHKMEAIQIEITTYCVLECSNCTRLIGHHKHPYMMTLDDFKNAIDSFEGYQGIVGMMGGEPLLHPKFEEFCEYALSKRDRMQLGLWSTFPEKFKRYREIICKTFGNTFLNDHSRSDIYHAPILVSGEEIVDKDGKRLLDKETLFQVVDDCWLQNQWSASVTPKGAYFCEVAAALAQVFKGSDGWKVEPGWWKRTGKDYKEQIEEFCTKCGCTLAFRRRSSQDETDDISPGNLKRLQEVDSPKIKKGKYVVSDMKTYQDVDKMAAYKDLDYRQGIAAKYGIFLVVNAKGNNEPFLKKDWNPEAEPQKSVFAVIQQGGSK